MGETMSEGDGRSIAQIRGIGGLEIDEPLELLGGEDAFWMALEDYYRVIARKAELIRRCYEQKDWKRYCIEVHALKSASRQIGALELAELAASLEAASREEEQGTIEAHHADMLERYRDYERLLSPFFGQETVTAATESIGEQELRGYFDNLRIAVDELDMDHMEDIAEALAGYLYPAEQRELLERLRESVEELDVDTCLEILQQWEALL